MTAQVLAFPAKKAAPRRWNASTLAALKQRVYEVNPHLLRSPTGTVESDMERFAVFTVKGSPNTVFFDFYIHERMCGSGTVNPETGEVEWTTFLPFQHWLDRPVYVGEERIR